MSYSRQAANMFRGFSPALARDGGSYPPCSFYFTKKKTKIFANMKTIRYVYSKSNFSMDMHSNTNKFEQYANCTIYRNQTGQHVPMDFLKVRNMIETV